MAELLFSDLVDLQPVGTNMTEDCEVLKEFTDLLIPQLSKKRV